LSEDTKIREKCPSQTEECGVKVGVPRETRVGDRIIGYPSSKWMEWQGQVRKYREKGKR
jgi:hypothetical protein